MEKQYYTVGELAKKAGVTVRTLQYYDRMGLLKSTQSEGGRRIYTRDDILKLQQILFYKSFGFPLERISANMLKLKTTDDLEPVFAQQREMLRTQIKNLEEIVKMLDTVIAESKRGSEITIDKLMLIIGLMKQGNPYTFMIRYFADDQLKSVADRFDSSNEYRQFMEKAQGTFTRMVQLYQEGADPGGAEGQALAASWWSMVTDFTQGDPAMLDTLLSAGRDIENWPENTESFHDAIEQFLSKALGVYFEKNGITLPDMEGKQNG